MFQLWCDPLQFVLGKTEDMVIAAHGQEGESVAEWDQKEGWLEQKEWFRENLSLLGFFSKFSPNSH